MDTPTSSTLDAADRDLRLCAFLDDELSGDDRAAVQRWLADDPAAAARLAALRADRDALRGLMGGIIEEPVPERLLRTAQGRRWSDHGGARWAAGVAVFVLGALAGGMVVSSWGPREPVASRQTNAWVQRAAVAHGVYTPEKRHPVEVGAQEEHLSRWLTRRLDVPVKLFDLRSRGFALMGGRLLPDAQGPGAQLMYERTDGTRVTVYLRRAEVSTPAAFRYERQGSLGLFYWVDERTGYALAGELPREELLALAQDIYAQGHAP